MNILSINMCGIRGRVKRKRLSNICSVQGVSFLGIQESRVTSINLFELRSMWGNFSFDFATSSARGLSGGIISIWDPGSFCRKKITCFENAIIVEGVWIFSKFQCFMVNVYAPQQDNQKRALWELLHGFMASNPGEYIFFGDYNAVRNSSERWECEGHQREADDINHFIIEGGLVDVPLGAFSFTRISANGEK